MTGQQMLKAHFKNLIKQQKLKNFYIINAPESHGKTSFVKCVSEMKKSPVVYVDNAKVKDVRNLISECQSLSVDTVFDINNADKLNLSSQNALLKLLEETPSKAYIFLEVSDVSKLLPTIISRACVVSMDPYTLDDLRQFTDDEILLDICDSPGMVNRFKANDWKKLIQFCNSVYDNIGQITLMNVFNIANYVSFKQGQPGFDLSLIMNTFQWRFKDNYEAQTALCYYKKQMKHVSVNKRNAFDMLMVKLWEVCNENK